MSGYYRLGLLRTSLERRSTRWLGYSESAAIRDALAAIDAAQRAARGVI